MENVPYWNHRCCTAHEIEDRAAQIRRSWSSAERFRRMGLPPDTPLRLRQYLEVPIWLEFKYPASTSMYGAR